MTHGRADRKVDVIDSKPLPFDLTGPFRIPTERDLGTALEIFCLDLRKTRSPAEDRALREALSVEERNGLSCSSTPGSLERFRSRAILRLILGHYLDQDPSQIVIDKAPKGKPRIHHPSLHFNLSHSGGRLVIGLSDQGELGIDIEIERHRARLEALVERVFSKEEQERTRRLDPLSLQRAFYRSWTLKEAYVKAVGAGISLGLDRVVLDEDYRRFLKVPVGVKEEFKIWFKESGGEHLALVYRGPEQPVRVWQER